ncbi:MAG: hypothetical protein RL434_1053 [Pseudomonadota bacterium]|jgi:uncharacterized membrane protein YfcA
MMDSGILPYVWVALAALAAGLVNALAGGGTLLSFPALVAVGVPPIVANVTNSVALCPGYLGGVLAQARDLRGQGRRLLLLVPAGAAGGVAGGLVLLSTGERLFEALVPFLILFATLILALQVPLRHWVSKRLQRGAGKDDENWAVLPIMLSAVYGGYFGAGLGMVMLAALGVTLNDTLTRINAIKQVLSLSINLAAVLYFVIAAEVRWSMAAVMAVAALIGGMAGGYLASRIRQSSLRSLMVIAGCVLSGYYFLR